MFTDMALYINLPDTFVHFALTSNINILGLTIYKDTLEYIMLRRIETIQC